MLENRTSCGCGIYGNSLIAVGGWGHAGPNGGVISAVKTAEFFDFQEGNILLAIKDWGPKKVTIYFPIFYLVKSSKNILFFYLHFT